VSPAGPPVAPVLEDSSVLGARLLRRARLPGPSRGEAGFLRWAALALPRAFAGPGLPPAALRAAWALGAGEVAARLALACARERRVAADAGGGAVLLRPRGRPAIVVPVARAGAFGLDRPDLAAARDPALAHPCALLAALAPDLSLGTATLERLAAELADGAFNLALARAVAELRARARLQGRRWPAPLDPENLVISGHPWHPMCKTRLGLRPHENLRHGPDACADAPVHAVDLAASAAVVVGPFAELLAELLPPAPRGWVRVPVHALQRRRLPGLLPGLWGGALRPVARAPVSARALLSLRTVATAGPQLKLAADLLTTSARRQVSPMSVRNGPPLGALLAGICAADPRVGRGLALQLEPAAVGLGPGLGPAGQLGALLRPPPAAAARALAGPGDDPAVWVCAALGERWPGDPDDLSAGTGMHVPEDMSPRACPPGQLDAAPGLLHLTAGDPLLRTICAAYPGPDAAMRHYVDLLVPPALRLLAAHGVALELHLQNTLVVHRRGRLYGFVARDLGGVRLHRPRLRAAGHALELAAGSFIATDDLAEVQTKLAHTLFHAHLAAVFAWAADLGADADGLWGHTRAVVDACLRAWAAEPRLAAACRADREALLAARVRAKALLSMRIDERSSEYLYTDVANALSPAG
jgi:siderophore synthetase component